MRAPTTTMAPPPKLRLIPMVIATVTPDALARLRAVTSTETSAALVQPFTFVTASPESGAKQTLSPPSPTLPQATASEFALAAGLREAIKENDAMAHRLRQLEAIAAGDYKDPSCLSKAMTIATMASTSSASRQTASAQVDCAGPSMRTIAAIERQRERAATSAAKKTPNSAPRAYGATTSSASTPRPTRPRAR